jgi:transcriptional regulator with XRE-family HTH domain
MESGHGRRLRPKKLKGKLLRIRQLLNLTQEGMVERLRPFSRRSPIYPGHISEFESGKREPSLLVLLAYAKVAGISTDILIDDSEELREDMLSISQKE